jgi:hypothetical protein
MPQDPFASIAKPLATNPSDPFAAIAKPLADVPAPYVDTSNVAGAGPLGVPSLPDHAAPPPDVDLSKPNNKNIPLLTNDQINAGLGIPKPGAVISNVANHAKAVLSLPFQVYHAITDAPRTPEE